MPPKQPLELAKFKKADKKNPQRYRTIPPKNSTKLPPAPAHFTPKQKKMYAEIVKNALPEILTASDQYVVEMTAVLLASFREDPGGFTGTNYSHLIKNLQLLGMTPVDRQRLHIAPPAKHTNDFDGY